MTTNLQFSGISKKQQILYFIGMRKSFNFTLTIDLQATQHYFSQSYDTITFISKLKVSSFRN